MASTEIPRNARAFAVAATLAAGVLLVLALARATRQPASPTVTVTPPGGATIVGRVVGQDGHGIEGLRVSVGGRSGVTAAGGAFAIAGLERGPHRLEVTGSGVVPAALAAVDAPAADLIVEVARAVSVAGRVTLDGRPAAGAHVEAAAPGLGPPRETTAGADGRFVLGGLAEGSYAVSARAAAAAALVDGVERFGAGPFADVELALAPAAQVSGRAVDETGAPVAGARVVLGSAAADAAQRRTLSDSDGRFTLEGLPPGGWVVDGHAPGLLPPARRALALQASDEPASVTLTFRHGATIAGRITDAAGGGISGAVVEVVGEDGRVVASASERARRAAWAAGTAAPSSGQLLPGGELGVLLGPIAYPPPPGARPAVPETAAAREDPAIAGLVTGADGAFHVDAVPPGRLAVRAVATGYARGESEIVQAPAQLTLVLHRGATVTVRVVNGDDAPVPGVQVRVGSGFGVTDPSGRARFEHVVGAPLLAVDGPSKAHAERAVAAPADLAVVEETIVLGAGASAAAPAGPTGTVRAELRDELTRGPILAFTAIARGPGGATLRKSGSRGELVLGPMAAGPWTIRIEARGFATRETSVDVEPGEETPIAFELSQGGVVGGTVYSEHGEPVAGATVECGPLRGTTSATGAFRLAGTDTGDVSVRAHHAELGQGEVIVPLHAGDEALTLEIRLSP